MGKWNWSAWPWTVERNPTQTAELEYHVHNGGKSRKLLLLKAIADVKHVYGDDIQISYKLKDMYYHSLSTMIIKITASVEIFSEACDMLDEAVQWR